MDTPTPAPTPPAPEPDPAPAPAAAPAPPAAPAAAAPSASRSAHVALGLVLAFTLGLLALRGYGSGLSARPTAGTTATFTDLNHADRAELEQVPGIGPALAKQIEDHRRAKGPFKSVEELRQVKGVGPVTFDKVRPFLRVDPLPPAAQPDPRSLEPAVLERRQSPPSPAPYPRAGGGGRKLQPGDPPVDVNAATVEQLLTIPGVGPVTAQNIVTARAERPFKSLADLDRVKGIGPKKLDQMRPFVVLKSP